MYIYFVVKPISSAFDWHYPERVIIRSEHPPEPHCKPAPFPTYLHWSHSQFGHSTWDTQTHEKTNTFTCGVCLFLLSYFRALKQHFSHLGFLSAWSRPSIDMLFSAILNTTFLTVLTLSSYYSIFLLLLKANKKLKQTKKFLLDVLYIICLQFVCTHSLLICYQYLLLLPLLRNLSCNTTSVAKCEVHFSASTSININNICHNLSFVLLTHS